MPVRLPVRAGRGAAFALCLAVGLWLPKGAAAQHHGSITGGHGGFGSPGSFGPSRGGMPPDIHERIPDRSVNRGGDRSAVTTMRGGLQVGPPGRWWDDKHFAKKLHLRADQKRRLDSIFEQNRTVLLKRFEALQQEEQRMETLTHASSLDENAIFAEIDRVEQARADLEKANTHLLFQIREEMDPKQLTSLADEQ